MISGCPSGPPCWRNERELIFDAVAVFSETFERLLYSIELFKNVKMLQILDIKKNSIANNNNNNTVCQWKMLLHP